ncbi:MAG: o-succinylbenzoate synthase [Deltaproteobacteria bacterium GWA2_57_13]|nr:MAG: o-succinylbenzoate synthase [Deltaproteobacteria bacterium GWA2_57_13]
MRLTRIEWIGYRIPFKNRFVAADVNAEYRHGLLLSLKTDGGTVGFGEASPVGAGDPRAVAALAEELRSLAPRILETGIIDKTPTQVPLSPLARAPAPLKFGIETARYDLLGKARGCSVATLLGGKPRAVPVNALLFSTSAEATATEARAAVEAGFGTLKLKVGVSSIQSDVERVAAVRQEVGPKISIRVDANQAWSVTQAVEAITRLGAFNIEYVEQPVPANDLKGLATVRKAVSTPIAADEAITSVEDVRRVVEMEAADFLIIKVARTGLLEAVAILNLAAEAGKPAVITSSLESDIGVAASLHLAASLGPAEVACGLATGLLLESTLASTPLVPSKGSLRCPDQPGLGIVPDETAVKKYAAGIKGSISL